MGARPPERASERCSVTDERPDARQANLANKVRLDYRVHMIMDNLPAATKMIAE